MDALETYIPQDRRRAFAENLTLPDRAIGAVLFADISGFTALTEAVTRSLGARRGAEALTAQLNAVYDALIAQIEAYGGSVISFSGDAALSWFDDAEDGRAASRAVTCAVALQNDMQRFAAVRLPDGASIALAIKVAVAHGSVRRFVVGDPQIRQIDVIAGSTVTRTALAEQLAHPGEILMDAATAQALAGQIEIGAWRHAPNETERFAVLKTLHRRTAPPPLPPPPTLDQTQLKPWLHAAVFERARIEDEAFLTELRPVVALFARFQGIAFDADDGAGDKLNQLISRAQQVLARYDGALLELTIGDKGSYFYAVFGAPHVHEDDARRAVLAARELFPLCSEFGFLEPLQVGISQGIMRVGAYGSATRRVYGAQGNDVNLAARLMSEAAPGTLLVSGSVQKTIANEFDLEPLPPIRLKGKTEPLLPFLVQGLRATRVQQLQEAYYTLPMIGRERELALVQNKLEQARRGEGQIIGITARAGVGKSRLTAEVIRTVRRQRESSYGGECQSFGANISYLVWVPIWRAFFGIDENLPLRRQIRALESELDALAPERIEALPLLGAVLNIAIPENEFTRALEPEFRKSALHALLRECLIAAAQEARPQGQQLLFVVEDAHWLDPASRELLEELASEIAALPVTFLINFRPPESEAERLARIERLSNFTRITLAELTDAQGEGLVRAKIAQHAPESDKAIPNELVARIIAQAQGNPFYIEQLLDYMHDRGMNLRDPRAFEQVELPNTLHRLILSRIDQLNERQQLTLKAASIIGRWFTLAHLCGYFPRLGSPEEVRADLARLQQFELAALDPSEPELAYLFKHIVTHQVAYESLAYATRAQLHEAYAQFLETHADAARTLDLIAFHYDHSENLPKRREYLRRAGQAAAARFANVEAVDYLTRALAATPPGEHEERYALLAARERVFDVQGDRERQRADLDALVHLTFALRDPAKHLNALLSQGWFAERISDHASALDIVRQLTDALKVVALPDETNQHFEIEISLLQGVILWQQGNAAAAKPFMAAALQRARATHEQAEQARALSFLGLALRELGENALAQSYYTELLQQARANGDKRREWSALNNLGLIANTSGEFQEALAYYMEGLRVAREIGDRPGEGLVLSNLAQTALEQGAYEEALEYSQQALALANTSGDRRSIVRITMNLGETHRLLGNYFAAQTHTERALASARELGDQLYAAGALMNLAAIALDRGALERAREWAEQTLPLVRAIQHRAGEAFLLNTRGSVQVASGEFAAAQETFENALALWQMLEPSPYSLQAHAGLAEIALARGNFQQARRHCDAILEFLNQHPQRAGDPYALAALLTCYHIARTADEPNASALLERAYAELQIRADKISNAELKRSFLENVPANAQIVREWNELDSR